MQVWITKKKKGKQVLTQIFSSSGLDLTPSMVAETPASELSKYSVPIVRSTKANAVSQNCSSSMIDHIKDGGKP